MKENFNTLRQRATQIKNEVEDGANTSARVGSFCEDVVDTMTGTITEYNVSVQHPTSGIDGSNKYSLEGAIAQVPQELRSIGLKVSFINSDGKVETWEFQGGTFTNIGSWVQGGVQKLSDLNRALYDKANIEDSPLSRNLLNIRGIKWIAGGYIDYDGKLIKSHTDYTYSDEYQDISYLAGKTIYSNLYKLSLYDFEKKFIKNITSYGVELPENTFFMRPSTWSGQKQSNEEIIEYLIENKSYVSLSNLGNNADEYKGRKIITDNDFKVTVEQMPDDYIPLIEDNSVGEAKLERELSSKINHKLDKMTGKNLCRKDECLFDKYMNSQGVIMSASGYALTGLIPIKNGQILRCNQKYQVSYNGLYDNNKQIIKSSLVQADKQQYLIGTEKSAYAQFSFGKGKQATVMVEEVDTVDEVSTEYEPYTDTREILGILGISEEINHPLLTKTFSFFNRTWVTFCDSFGITGVTYTKTDTLFVREETYGYRTTEQGYTWHRYIGDYLQLGGLINNAVGGSCISNAYTLFPPFSERVDSIPQDDDVALVLLEGGTNDWYYNVPIGDAPLLYGEQNGAVFDELDESRLDKGTFKSAYAYTLLKLQKAYPNAIIVAVTPIYGARLCSDYVNNTSGYNEAGKNKVGLTLLDYVDAEIEIAGMLGIPVIDGYRTSGINCGNWKQFISADGVHPWVKGGNGMKMYGRMIVGGLQRILAILPEIPKP